MSSTVCRLLGFAIFVFDRRISLRAEVGLQQIEERDLQIELIKWKKGKPVPDIRERTDSQSHINERAFGENMADIQPLRCRS